MTSGVRSFTWDAAEVQRLIGEGLKAGRTISLNGLRPWRHPKSGDVLYYPSRQTSVEVLADSV